MDEDSMAGRPFWGQFKHKLEEFRKIKLKVDEDYNAQTLSNDKYTELTKRILKEYLFLTLCVTLINFLLQQ